MAVGAISGASLTSTAGIEKLIQQAMALERRPLTRLETQKDDLNVKKAIYSDIKTKLETLRTSIQDLTGTDGSLNSFKASVNNADILAATVTSSSSLTASQFNVTVNNLAVANQFGSVQQAHSNEALGITGSLVIGGAASRSVSNINTPQPNTVANFSANTAAGAIRQDQTELGTGTYTVEVRHYQSTTWQFRMVDQNGNAVSVDDAADTGTAMTSAWQNLDNVAGTTFDTGRGLQIDFGSGPYTEGLKGMANTASVDYTAQGASLTVNSSDTLLDIRDAINNATFASGNQVVASVVDNKLVLTAKTTGTQSAIQLTDSTTGGIDGLGLQLAQITPAEDASVTVNGITVTRQKNSGLSDIIAGLSLDLTGEGSTQIAVAKDNSDVVDRTQTFIDNLNDLLRHLKLKTEPQLDETATGTNPTYKPAPLGRDSNIRSLRFDLSSDLFSMFSGAASGAPNDVSDIGISVNNEDFSLELSTGDLTTALDDNFEGVSNLLDYVLGKMESRIDTYLDGTSAFITLATDDINDRIDLLDTRIDSYETRLSKREESLRQQYYELQGQLLDMQYQFQQTQAAMSGSMNILG